jgi:hypothetical protein
MPVRYARGVLPFARKCRRIGAMTRLVIARLALRGERFRTSRTSLEGLGRVTSPLWSRISMTTTDSPSASSGVGAASLGGASSTMTVSPCVVSITSASSRACPAGALHQGSLVRSAPPAVQPRLAPQRLISRLPRFSIVGGIPGLAVVRAGSDCLIRPKGGGPPREQ